MKKWMALALCLVFVCASFGACSQPASSSSAAPTPSSTPADSGSASPASPDRVYKIGINSYAENFESSQNYLTSFREAAEKAGNVEFVYADCNADAQKVAPNYDSFILQGVDAIIDASWLGEAGTMAVEKCKAAGIPLVVCDTAFDEEYSYLIGTDNYEAGVIAGEYLAGYIKENWDGAIDYLVLEYYQSGGEHVKDRMQGCVDGLRDSGIDLTDDQVVWFDNEAQTQKTNQITRDFLTAHPDAHKVIFGTNNDPCAIGMVSAVEAANRVDDCICYSYGGEDSALDLLEKDNCYVGSVSFQQNLYGDFAIPTAIDLIEGKTDVPRVQGPMPIMVDRSNLSDYR